jgi:nicotinate-nucleotide adenylyltransferase
VLGSAFNPPHVGHLVLAQEAAAQLGLARVVLVPTGRAPHRRIPDDPGPEVRLELARAAADGGPVAVEDFEVREARRDEEPSYTYRTLERLKEQGNDELVWIMGADAAAGLGQWRKPERILELARIAVARRPGVDPAEVESALDGLGGIERVEFLEMPEIGVSSTLVRERIAKRLPVRYLVPDAVAELIDSRGLYA